MKESDFRKKQKLPIKLLNLGETEELVVARSKLRPCIVLTIGQTSFSDLTKALKQAGKGHLEKEDLAAIPIYSVEKEDGDTGFPAVMAARIKALMYPQFFFCPKHPATVPNNSIARLDRIFFIRPLFPGFQLTDAALSPDALMVLRSMLAVLLGLVMSEAEFEAFSAVRNLVQEALPDEAKYPMV